MTTTTRNEIRIDRTKTLADDAGTGHNRWPTTRGPDTTAGIPTSRRSSGAIPART
jgi:hypothetical protein